MPTVPSRRARLLACGVVAAVLLAACGDDGPTPSAGRDPRAVLASLQRADQARREATVQYVGKVEGSDAYIGITEVDGELEVYLCDGADLVSWLTGSLEDDGTFSATADRGADQASGTVAGDQVRGTATVDGVAHAFSATRAALPAGVYVRSGYEDGHPVTAATIVLPDGTQRGQRRKHTIQEICAGIKKSFQEYQTSFMAAEVGSQDEADNLAGIDRQGSNFVAHDCEGVVGPITT